MAGRYNLPNAQPSLGVNGQVEPGARALFFQPGTGTARQVFTDYALTVPHTQPILSDASGRWPDIFDTAGARADVRWETPAGVLIDLMPDVIATASSADFVSPGNLLAQIETTEPWNGGRNYKAGQRVTQPAYSGVWKATADNFNAPPGVSGSWVLEQQFVGGVMRGTVTFIATTATQAPVEWGSSGALPAILRQGMMGFTGGGMYIVANTGSGLFVHTLETNLTRRNYWNETNAYEQIAPGAWAISSAVPTTTELNRQLLFIGAGMGKGLNAFRMTGTVNAYVSPSDGPQDLGVGLFVDGVCVGYTLARIVPGLGLPLVVCATYSPPDFNGRTYALRVGAPSSNTAPVWLNGRNTGRIGGPDDASSVTKHTLELSEVGGF